MPKKAVIGAMAHILDAVIQLKDNFSSTIKTVEKNVGSFSRTTKKMGRDIQRVGKDLESLGSNMTKKVTLPTVALGTAMVKSALDLEDGVAKIGTIADTTKMSLEDIRKGLLDISDVTGIAVTDLAEAEYNAISSGVDTAKSLEFIETASKASKAGFADMDTTIDALTTTLNAYGLGTEKAMDISNQMLKAQDYGKTTVAEMGASLGNVIPIASQLGVSTEELFASMAILTKNGIKTSEAVTGLKGAYSNILKPSKQASDLAESLGLNFNAAHLQSVGWAKFLDEVKEKTGGNAEQMAQLFGSVQGLNSVMVLTGKGNKDFNNVLGQMGDVAGLTDEKFEQLLTPAQKLKIEFNKLKNTGIEFGVELMPLVTQFTEKLGQVTEKIKNLSPEQRQMIVKFAGMAAIMGPVIGVIGKMTTGVGKMVTEFGFFAGRIKNLGLIGAIFTPGVKVVLIIGAIIGAVILLIKNFDKVKAKANEVFPNMQQTISTSIEHIKNIFWGLSRVLSIVMLPVQLAFFTAWEIIKNVFVVAVETIGGVISGLLQALSGIIDFITGVFTGNWELAWQGVQDIFGGIFKGLVALAKAPLNLIIGLVNGVIGGLNKIKLPKWVPKIGGKGINIPLIPKLAKGTSNWQGGIVQVHEQGGEIIDLPRGSRVYPHDKSVRMARKEGKNGVLITGNTFNVREESDIDKIADALARKIEKASLNMA